MYRSSPFRSTVNTSYTTGLDMCKVCTEAVRSVALWTRVTVQVWTNVKWFQHENGFAWQAQYICNVCMNQPCTRSAKTLKNAEKREVTENSWYGKTDMKTRPYRSMGPKTNKWFNASIFTFSNSKWRGKKKQHDFHPNLFWYEKRCWNGCWMVKYGDILLEHTRFFRIINGHITQHLTTPQHNLRWWWQWWQIQLDFSWRESHNSNTQPWTLTYPTWGISEKSSIPNCLGKGYVSFREGISSISKDFVSHIFR